MKMQYSKSGLALTERFEGCRLVSYQDSIGVWTIGYGHTKGVVRGMTCTQEQAFAWLLLDSADATATVNRYVTLPSLTQNEFDALVDFTFNCGGRNLITSTLLKLVNADQIAHAADEFARWDHAGGHVVAGLLTRRLAERDEFLGDNHVPDHTLTPSTSNQTGAVQPSVPLPTQGA